MNMLLLTSLLLLACASPSNCPPAQSPTANVLIIIADDLGLTERALVPSLDGLAVQGVTCTRAYSFPVCTTTRLAFLTGLYPRRFGVGGLTMNAHAATGQDRLPLDATTLAELFKPTHSTALIGKWHMGRAPLIRQGDQVALAPYCQGFDTWTAGSPTLLSVGPQANGYYAWNRVEKGNFSLEHRYVSDVQTEQFLDWWGVTQGLKFAVLAYCSPHKPWDTPPGKVAGTTDRERYELVIQNLNTQLATVLASVDLSDTYVLFFGDNGTPDEGRVAGSPSLLWKGSTHEGGVRVPFIIAGPGITPGGITDRLISVLDIGPTLAELAGLPAYKGFDDGSSVADSLGIWAGSPPRTFIFSEVYEVSSFPYQAGYDDQAVIEAEWKLRRWDADGNGPGTSIDRAYHIPSDPWGMRPIDPTLLPNTLRNRLYAELASIPPRAP